MGRKPRSLKEALKGKLSPEEMEKLVTSFDIIGKIAITDIPEELKKKEKIIGEALLETHHNLRTVCKRADIHKGRFRIRAVKVIAGEKNTETEYVESGTRMRLDVAKVYFTPRLSHERERIAKQVKPGETIGAFFAGVGPFALVIAKRQLGVKIHAIELNPVAVEYMKENIRINRAQMIVEPVLGDVRELGPKLLKGKCDRIVMPLPKSAEDFLDTALECAASGCVIHFYQFGRREDPFSEALEKINAVSKRNKRKVRILSKKVVRPYSPSVVQVVIDFRVEK